MFNLKNKKVIITGATGGIGNSIIKSFVQQEAKVLATGTNEEKLKLLKNTHSNIITKKFDISKHQDIEKFIEDTTNLLDGNPDILVNNAGILRDKSFHKMTLEDFDAVMQVHFQGSLYTTHAVYPLMREQGFGRIIHTSSSSGTFGNFGQTNYSAAKMALIGMMNTMKIEGQKYNVHSNAILPVAYTRMTKELLPEEGVGERLQPEYVTPAVIYLASDDAPNGVMIGAGAGVFTRIMIHETMGVALGTDENMTPENIAANWDAISDMSDARALYQGGEQTIKIFEQADKN